MPEPRPLSDDEAVRVIAAALLGTGGRPLTREADLFLATMAAESIYDRLALAGVGLSSQPAGAAQIGSQPNANY